MNSKIISVFRTDKKIITILLVSSLLIYIANVIFPLTISKAIDAALDKNLCLMLKMLSLAAIASVIEITATNGRLKTIVRIGSKIELKLNGITIRSVLSKKHNPTILSTGKILNIINHIKTIRDFFLQSVPQAALDIGQLILSLLVIAYFSRSIAAIIIVTLAVTIVFFKFYAPTLASRTSQYFDTESNTQDAMASLASTLKPIKCHAAENFRYRHLMRQVKASCRALRHVSHSSRIMQSWMSIITRGLTLTTLGCGGVAVSVGNLSIGELITIQILCSKIISPVIGAGDLLGKFQEMRSALTQLTALDNLDADKDHPHLFFKSLEDSAIVLNEISSFYEDGRCALNQVTITLPKAGLIILTGKNGSGKSSFALTVLGINDIANGEIWLPNKHLPIKNLKEFRKSVSLTLQDPDLFPGTLRENLVYDSNISDEEIYYILEELDLTNFVDSLPLKLNFKVGTNGQSFSGGQKQKICLARALLKKNSLYILDEPTSAMDGESSRQVIDCISTMGIDNLILCISHDTNLMQKADNILFMEHGRITATGTHSALKTSCEAYNRLYFPDL